MVVLDFWNELSPARKTGLVAGAVCHMLFGVDTALTRWLRSLR